MTDTESKTTGGPGPKPPWLKVRIGQGSNFKRLCGIVHEGCLHTVCEEALCPNRGECWEKGRATLMILGDTCSRACAFCNVSSTRPGAVDPDEAARVEAAVRKMGLQDVVITSVTRDDLADGGAAVWVDTIRRVRALRPRVYVEALIPDFGGDAQALDRVLKTRPDVLGHNLETVSELYDAVRPQARYQRSLDVLSRSHAEGLITKTSVMLGLGETRGQLLRLMDDARAAGADVLFMGQYLQPSKRHAPVHRYVTPGEFDALRDEALARGFDVVISAPLVRSSYHSGEQERYVRSRLG